MSNGVPSSAKLKLAFLEQKRLLKDRDQVIESLRRVEAESRQLKNDQINKLVKEKEEIRHQWHQDQDVLVEIRRVKDTQELMINHLISCKKDTRPVDPYDPQGILSREERDIIKKARHAEAYGMSRDRFLELIQQKQGRFNFDRADTTPPLMGYQKDLLVDNRVNFIKEEVTPQDKPKVKIKPGCTPGIWINSQGNPVRIALMHPAYLNNVKKALESLNAHPELHPCYATVLYHWRGYAVAGNYGSEFEI